MTTPDIHGLPPLPLGYEFVPRHNEPHTAMKYWSNVFGIWSRITHLDIPVLRFDRIYCRPIVGYDPVAPGHNPDGVTLSQLGEGYRLLREDEIKPRDVDSRIQVWITELGWSSGVEVGGYRGSAKEHTFRVPIDWQEGVKPEPDYGDMTGWRLLEVGEAIPERIEQWINNKWFPLNGCAGDTLHLKGWYLRTPTERPLLTPQDFMKDGPWWVRGYGTDVLLVVRINSVRIEIVDNAPTSYEYQELRDLKFQRSNDGINWEDC